MHCREALEQLEAARPDDQGLEPEFAEANSHLADCEGCRAEFGLRQKQDARISAVFRDVPGPPGLKAGILSALREDSSRNSAAVALPDEESKTPQPRDQRFSRRRWLAAAVSVAAVCTLFGLVFWKKTPVVQPGLTLADLRRDTPLDLSPLEEFDGKFAAKLPGGVWQLDCVQFDKQPKGDFRGPNGGPHRAALYGFRVRGERGRDVQGVMLVMQRGDLDDPPPPDSQYTIVDSPGNYARRPNGTYHAFVWSTDDRVFVCFVPARGDSLERLKNALIRPPV